MDWTLTTNAPGKIVLMQGNEAIVRGAVESGIHFAASYPGSPSSQILGMLGKIAKERNFYAQWATNEVCALEACIGTSLANARSIGLKKMKILFKHVTPNVLAPFTVQATLALSGMAIGMLLKYGHVQSTLLCFVIAMAIGSEV